MPPSCATHDPSAAICTSRAADGIRDASSAKRAGASPPLSSASQASALEKSAAVVATSCLVRGETRLRAGARSAASAGDTLRMRAASAAARACNLAACSRYSAGGSSGIVVGAVPAATGPSASNHAAAERANSCICCCMRWWPAGATSRRSDSGSARRPVGSRKRPPLRGVAEPNIVITASASLVHGIGNVGVFLSRSSTSALHTSTAQPLTTL